MIKPDNEARHRYCPRGKEPWCKYQSDKCTGESTYKSRISIPTAVREVINPIFSHEDRGADALLKNVYMDKPKIPMRHLIIVFGERLQKIHLLLGEVYRWL